MNKKSAHLQIWLPLALTIFLTGIFAYFLFKSAYQPQGISISQWSNISLIFLLIPSMVLGIILFLLCIVCISLMNSSSIKIFQWLKKSENFSAKLKQKTQSSCQKVIILLTGPSLWFKVKGKREIDGKQE